MLPLWKFGFFISTALLRHLPFAGIIFGGILGAATATLVWEGVAPAVAAGHLGWVTLRPHCRVWLNSLLLFEILPLAGHQGNSCVLARAYLWPRGGLAAAAGRGRLLAWPVVFLLGRRAADRFACVASSGI